MATTEQASSQFDLGIWYTLSLWPALTVAVQNNWGGPDSAGKRDWFAGAISELFDERPDTDSLDVEAVLLQVMQDEFDVNVEDETEVPVAAEIMKLRAQCNEGDFSGVQEVKQRFEARKSNPAAANNMRIIQHKGDADDDDDEDDDDSEDDDDDGDDVEMGDAPAPAPAPRPRAEPEVDDDGFTKVVGKKRR